MIKIKRLVIKEVRGVRDLTLDLNEKSFVVCGPNGSGKSGVVDAIEFCLTGEISRLAGKGTGGITLQKHGPHVNQRDHPNLSEVTIELHLVDLNKTVTISRNMKTPSELKIGSSDPVVQAAVKDLSSHPELVLSRREIIKYVLAEAGERSKEVQALLRLDGIGQTRTLLYSATNKLKVTYKTSTMNKNAAYETLKRHLGFENGTIEDILKSVNERRKLLGLDELEKLDEGSALDVGIESGPSASSFNKESALRDLAALTKSVSEASTLANDESAKLIADIDVIDADPTILELLKRDSFIHSGLELVDSAFCPLCDIEWADTESLRKHIEDKIAKSTV
ncbi:MAG TPA: ATP-binding protein, partial [Rhabdochlamydiaceae bacterium]